MTELCFPPCILPVKLDTLTWLIFFSHENQSYPPSLSNYGALISDTKADLLVPVCVSEQVPHHDTIKLHEAHMVILDGAAIVNMIKPRTPVSFDGYVTHVMEYACKQFRGDVQRVDMVFDAGILILGR